MHPDLQAQNHDVLDDMPSPVLPPLPPDQRPFEFSSFIRRTGGDTTSLLSAIRETDAHLPPGPIIVYSERAGGDVRCITLHIRTCILCQSTYCAYYTLFAYSTFLSIRLSKLNIHHICDGTFMLL